MRIFITGASGFIGGRLAHRLVADGHTVRALVRSPEKATDLIHPNIEVIKGDLANLEALRKGMEGCQQAYHLAAYAKVYAKDPSIFYDINVQGTLNVMDVALEQGVERIVVTSTGGTLGPSRQGKEKITEENFPTTYFNDYEKTKAESEDKVREYARKGQHVVLVNPTRLYGPGELSESNIGTRMVKQYINGKWRFLPGNGHKIGSYVYVEDVVEGHLLAMEHGRAGERYILGGENASYREFFEVVREISGKRYRLFIMPVFMLMIFAQLQAMKGWFGGRPVITKSWVRRFLHHWVISTDKAEKELGYKPTSLKDGMRITIEWLNTLKE